MGTLVGVQAKIERAKVGLKALENEISKLCDDQKTAIIREIHEVDEQAWVFRGPTPMVPIEWSVRIGEVVYHLRTALDHLVWQLVISNKNLPSRRNSFPILDTNKKWQKEGRSSLAGVSSRTERLVKHLQPYSGGINLDFDVSNFSILNTLVNIDKHRYLNLGIFALNGITPLVSEEDLGQDPPFKGSGYLGPIQSNKELLRFSPSSREIPVEFDICLLFQDPQELNINGNQVICTLNGCLQAVNGAVDLLRPEIHSQ